METSRKILRCLAISLLLLTTVKAQELAGAHALVDTTTAADIETYAPPTPGFSNADCEFVVNRTENLTTNHDSNFSPPQRKYIVILAKLNWYAAYAFCEKYGWSLASTETSLEQFQLQNYLNFFNFQYCDLWISGNNLADLQTFRWGHNGSQFVYNNWEMGGPNYSMAEQSCVKLQKNTLKWENDLCENSHHFICQMQ